VVDGAEHKRQRKILTPAFTGQRVGGLVPHFWKKGCELQEYLNRNAVDSEDVEENGKRKGFEVFNCLTRTTLDIIGLAGNSHFLLPSPYSIFHYSPLFNPPFRSTNNFPASDLLSYRPAKPSLPLSSSQIFQFKSSFQFPSFLTSIP